MPYFRPPFLRIHALALGIAIGLLTGVQSARAQSSLDYGVRTSAVSTTTDHPSGEEETLWGIGAAAYVERHVAGPFSARLELRYTPRRLRQFYYGWGSDLLERRARAKTRLHFLSVPLLARAGTSLGTLPINVYALLGLHADLLVSHSTETSSSSDSSSDRTAADPLADRYDEVTFGMSRGIGVAVDIGDVALTVEILQHRDYVPTIELVDVTPLTLILNPLRKLSPAVSVGVKR